MNQVLVDFIERWTEEHDPMKKAVQKHTAASTSSNGGEGKKDG